MGTNVSGCLIAGALALATGHLTEGIAFCTRHPEVLTAVFVYSLASAVGQNFVYYTLFSVFRNPNNSLSEMQWGGICLVFAGLLLDVASKFLPGKKAAPKKETEMSQVKGEGKAKRTSKAD